MKQIQQMNKYIVVIVSMHVLCLLGGDSMSHCNLV
jgi:hypothetical protein